MSGKNKGLFKVHEDLTKQPMIMAKFFERFRPLRFDLELRTGVYFILCESDEFDEVKEGYAIPFYDLLMRRNEDGSIEITELNKV